MKITEINWHLDSKQFTESATNPRTLALITIFGYAIYQLLMPIRLGDTDMWYHLNGGRYFWDNLQIPSSSFFSFITPEKEWSNYFWGFQAIIFKIYDFGGYYGLALLRSVLVIASTLIVYKLIKNTIAKNNPITALLILLSFLLIFDERTFQLRPHLFSYFFILLYFYIVIINKPLIPLLPLLTILWANIHGVEWPVAAIILGAYFIHTIIKVHKEKKITYHEKIIIVSFLLCPFFFLINPNTWELYLSPFNIDSNTGLYIQELQSIDPKLFVTIQVIDFTITSTTAITVYTLLAIITLLTSLKNKNFSPELFIFLVGLFLLSKGRRFLYEWLLLSTPFITIHLKLTKFRDPAAKVTGIFLILFSILTINTLYRKSLAFSDYPFNTINIPNQTTKFINSLDISGKIMSAAGMNGYYEWELHPNFKTFIDMQFPPSTDWEMFLETYAFKTKNGLNKFLKKFSPDLIIADFKKDTLLIKNLESVHNYKPIYTDDFSVIYLEYQLLLSLPKLSELIHTDLITLRNKSANKEEHVHELKHLLSLVPESKRISRALFNVHRTDKNFDKALYFAEHYLSLDPENPDALYILAIAQQDLENTESALRYFNLVYQLSSEASKKEIGLNLAENYFINKDFLSCYQFYEKYSNPYKTIIETHQLYMYAYSAAMIGKTEKAISLFNMFFHISDIDENRKLHNDALEMHKKIISGEYDVMSFPKWLISKLKSLFTD